VNPRILVWGSLHFPLCAEAKGQEKHPRQSNKSPDSGVMATVARVPYGPIIGSSVRGVTQDSVIIRLSVAWCATLFP